METTKLQQVEPKALTGAEKAITLLLSLPDEQAKKIMEGMKPEEIRKIALGISKIGNQPQEVVSQVSGEFVEQMETGYGIRGGSGQASDFLTRTLGKEKGRAAFLDSQGEPKEKTAWTMLNGMQPAQIAAYLNNEHRQSIALILSQLDEQLSSMVLEALPQDVSAEAALRMGRLKPLAPGALEIIEQSLRSELEKIEKQQGLYFQESGGGVKKVANLLNLASPEKSREILNALDEIDPDLHESVRKEMFLFEDLKLMDSKSLQKLVREAVDDVLLKALKGADERLKEKIFESTSDRHATRLREELSLLPPTQRKDVEEAQQSILKLAREMAASTDDRRKIMLPGKGGDDFVV